MSQWNVPETPGSYPQPTAGSAPTPGAVPPPYSEGHAPVPPGSPGGFPGATFQQPIGAVPPPNAASPQPYVWPTSGPGSFEAPFAPEGVHFHPVQPRLRTARMISAAISWGIVLLPLIILGFIFSWHLGIVIPLVILTGFAVWTFWLIPRQVKAWGYAERTDDLLIRRGVLFKKMTVVPYGRMQFVDVAMGPIERAMKIASVKLHTAAPATDATVPGLDPDEAERLRDNLAARGEARLAGL